MTDSLFAGVDVGAFATKAVLLNQDATVVGRGLAPSGMDFEKAGTEALNLALKAAGVTPKSVVFTVSTGYGRKNVARRQLEKTEITCHGRGVYHFFKEPLTIVDIGGQDNKIIKLDQAGSRLDFKMNRKCAAGTGAFLEEIARRISVPLDEMADLAAKSTQQVNIGSFCTVFSATEILSLIRQGAKIPDIVKGAFRSIVKRVTEMDPLNGKVVATGGVVAHNPVVLVLLSEAIGSTVETPPTPQFSGAMGAALFAIDASQSLD